MCFLGVCVVFALHLLAAPTFALKYNPAKWNQMCTYKVRNVEPQKFFADRDPLFPLERGQLPAASTYPTDACFGPGETYDDTLVAKRKKLPCQYKFAKGHKVDYVEEQPCASTVLSNCYCYAIGRPSNGYCIPGLGSGSLDGIVQWDCATLNKYVTRDGGKLVPYKTVMAGKPKGSHFIAAAVSPPDSQLGNDFHFWRLDSNGVWSWKAGYTFVRNTYSNGTLVRDVRRADIRKLYPKICGFFDVDIKNHKLGDRGTTNSPIPFAIQLWKDGKLDYKVVKRKTWSAGWYSSYQDSYVKPGAGDLTFDEIYGMSSRRTTEKQERGHEASRSYVPS